MSPIVPKTGAVEREVARVPAPEPRAPSSVEPSGDADAVVSAPGSGSHAQGAAAPTPAQPGSKPPRPAPPDSGAGSSDSAPGSIRAAMPAPSEEWLAHLWPAVALGPAGSVLAAQVAELAPSLLPASLSSFVRAFLSPISAPTGGGPIAPSTARTASPDSPSFFSPGSGGMSFLVAMITVLATLVGLVALARLIYGEDFFSMRWLR